MPTTMGSLLVLEYHLRHAFVSLLNLASTTAQESDARVENEMKMGSFCMLCYAVNNSWYFCCDCVSAMSHLKLACVHQRGKRRHIL